MSEQQITPPTERWIEILHTRRPTDPQRRFRIKSRNGQYIAAPTEEYATREAAIRGARNLTFGQDLEVRDIEPWVPQEGEVVKVKDPETGSEYEAVVTSVDVDGDRYGVKSSRHEGMVQPRYVGYLEMRPR
jgi:hypothetical protein